METKKFSISGSTLKWFAILCMFIDHFAASFLNKYMASIEPSESLRILYKCMRLIGRPAFPIFIFLLIEGLEHTRNLKKYLFRLFLFALISDIPFDLAFYDTPFYWGYQNVFFTLFLGLLTIWMLKNLDEKWSGKRWLQVTAILSLLLIPGIIVYVLVNNLVVRIPQLHIDTTVAQTPIQLIVPYLVFLTIVSLAYLFFAFRRSLGGVNLYLTNILVIFIGMILADLLKTDYSFIGVLAIVIMYRLRANHAKEMLGGTAALLLSSTSEIAALITLLPISLYNGTRGHQLKYFFYIFYPAHLLLIWLLGKLLLGA